MNEIVEKVVHDLFTSSHKSEGFISLQIQVSCMEIYNEEVRDLLSDAHRSDLYQRGKGLDIREDQYGDVQIKDLTSKEVKCARDLQEVFNKAERKRTTSLTNMNNVSSRSHMITRINIKIKAVGSTHEEKENSCNASKKQEVVILESTLDLVDLAGSENANKANTYGPRRREGENINTRCV